MVVFRERYAMVQSQKNAWTRMISSWKCVEVSLSPTRLRLKLHGLMGLLLKCFFTDIEHVVPTGRVVSFGRNRKYLGYDEIYVIIEIPGGGTRKLLLYLERGTEFIEILRSYREEEPGE